MKTKKAPILKIGRPVKMAKILYPLPQNNNGSNIFKQCKAPSNWGKKEMRSIWEVLMNSRYPGSSIDTKTFVEMWVEDTEKMLLIMSKFKRLADKILKKQEYFIVQHMLHIAALAQISRYGAAKDSWNRFCGAAKADDIAQEYNEKMHGKMKFTGKHVSKAREKIRRLFPELMKKR
jgi:hypothetical protein